MKTKDFIEFIRDLYKTDDFIPLHEPLFDEADKKAMDDVIDSTFVSSVGPLVKEFENKISEFTGSQHAVAVVNGTAALHIALLLAGVKNNDEVLTQSLNFVASTNAIHQCNAFPVFIDVDRANLGMCPKSLKSFLEENCEVRDDGFCWNKSSNRIIKVCMPMHTFGMPVEMAKLRNVCKRYNLMLVEDAAESLGSFYGEKHTGTFGDFGTLSFNGNKIITTGAGGMILTNDSEKASLARHLTTTAKVDKEWFFEHDKIAFNYRMPNMNAALGISQLDKLQEFLNIKRRIARMYLQFSESNDYHFIKEPEYGKSNYWLNAFILDDEDQRDRFLRETNKSLVMTRAAWNPMHTLSFNKNYQTSSLENTHWLFQRIVNVPSSAKGFAE